ncbi:MAG TPA: helix-turn-helix transcriptional regulator [Anaerovoracaceae bacterium]|nr:helix-turn-helix transcriptional regulator [Anaerovoracaceae bacterium]
MKNKQMKIARIEQDMKQEDLAKIAGVTRQTIGMIESGNYNPTLNLCISICKALNKTLNELFWEETK